MGDQGAGSWGGAVCRGLCAPLQVLVGVHVFNAISVKIPSDVCVCLWLEKPIPNFI